jgi:predicted RNA polymerase sigma factor
MALSLQDQTPTEEPPSNPNAHKEPFVTTQNQDTLDRMSEASKTNRLHSSAMSKDEDSKVNKESSQEKQKIDEEFDDITDYNDVSM